MKPAYVSAIDPTNPVIMGRLETVSFLTLLSYNLTKGFE